MFSPSIERAIRVTLAAHSGQFRKGDLAVPYVVHPLHVAFMLARLGMDDVVIQAALLHDVVEDCADWTLGRLAEEFGNEVAEVVSQLTEEKHRPWAERKRLAIEHVEHLCPRALAVKAADKLHNLESLAAELTSSDDHAAVWSRFRGGREGTLRVARELVAVLLPRLDEPFAGALRSALAELERLA